MKNLTRKLFLSICTLAICAVTLVSTTFAWYTTNTEVSATNINASTSVYGDASIFISTDTLNWYQSVDVNKTMTALLPVQVTSTGVFDDRELGDTLASDTDYLKFTLYVKTAKISDETDADPIALFVKSITINNTTFSTIVDTDADEDTTADNEIRNYIETIATDNLLYNSSKNTGGVDKTQGKYWVDVTEALWMNIESSTVENLNHNIFDLKNCLNTKYSPFNVANPDAEVYYESVSGDTLEKSGTATEYVVGSTGTNFEIANLAANGDYTTLTFKIFLNGWDEYCFDACKGQSFSVALSFTTDPQQAKKYVAE